MFVTRIWLATWSALCGSLTASLSDIMCEGRPANWGEGGASLGLFASTRHSNISAGSHQRYSVLDLASPPSTQHFADGFHKGRHWSWDGDPLYQAHTDIDIIPVEIINIIHSLFFSLRDFPARWRWLALTWSFRWRQSFCRPVRHQWHDHRENSL